MMPELYLADALGCHRQAAVPGAHRRARSAARPPSWPPSSCRPASTSGCSPSPSRSSPRARPCGRSRCRSRSRRRCTRAPAATSPRTSAATCAGRRRPTTSACSSPLKDRQNALQEPVRPPARATTSRSTPIKDSMMLWDPIRYAETCPSSDGACALVLGSETVGDAAASPATRRRGSTARPCAASRPCRPTATPCCRSAARSARPTCTARPASPTRAARSTASRCTCRSRGSSRCGSRTSASPSRARVGGWWRTGPPRSTATSR